MDTDLFLRLFDQINKKIDDLSQSVEIAKNEVGAIKTRLFNGLSDTTRETYAKVIMLESKQNQYDDIIQNMQTTWIEKFTVHDTKERLYHSLVATIMAFLVTVFTALLVFELEKYHMLKLMAHEVTPELSWKKPAAPKDSGPVLEGP